MSAGHSAVGKDGKRDGEEGVWESISRGQREIEAESVEGIQHGCHT